MQQPNNGDLDLMMAGNKRSVSSRASLEAAALLSSSSSDSSSSSSDSSESESSTSSSGSSSSEEESVLDNLFEEDEGGRYLNVSCADNEAKFYLKRFSRGSVGKCILFKSRWVTPNEFQTISGRKSSKDWKRSIRLRGRCLKEFIAQGLFQEHAKNCVCQVCSGDNAELLKQEGEMALAAKRRRLSQADTTTSLSSSVEPLATRHVNNEKHVPMEGAARAKVTRLKKQNAKKESGKISEPPHKIWSPSGEVAPDTSIDNEHATINNAESTNTPTQGVVDSSDYIPRRSRRTNHRKHTQGHRTELGTFKRKPSEWGADEVLEFLRLQGFNEYIESFTDCEIDGPSLFLLKEQHLMDKFSMKLGPALRLIDSISRLRHPPLQV